MRTIINQADGSTQTYDAGKMISSTPIPTASGGVPAPSGSVGVSNGGNNVPTPSTSQVVPLSSNSHSSVSPALIAAASVPAPSQDDQTNKLLSDIGRSQTAYWQYVNAGRPDLAQQANTWANQDRSQLQTMGVDANLYKQGVDLRNMWNGGSAASYDPTKPGSVPVTTASSQVPKPPDVTQPQAPQAQQPSVPAPTNLYQPLTMDQIKQQVQNEIQAKIASQQAVANQQIADLQRNYNNQMQTLTDNRTLEDKKFWDTHNPYSGGTDYQKAVLARQRNLQDTQLAQEEQANIGKIQTNLSNFSNEQQGTVDKQVNDLVNQERNYQLAQDKFGLDKSNTQFNQNLDTQKLADTEATQNAQLTGQFVNPKVAQIAQGIINDKQAWAQTSDPNQQQKIAQDAANLRSTLSSYGINADQLFGANVPLEQALKNMGQLGTPTLQAKELGLKNQQFQFDKQLQTNELNLKNQQFQFDQNKWAQEFNFNKDEKAKADQLEQERISQQSDYQGWLKQKGINEQQAGKATNGYAGEIIAKIGAGDIASREDAYKYITDHQSDIAKDGADINKLMGIIDNMYPRPRMATADPTANPNYYNQYYGQNPNQ